MAGVKGVIYSLGKGKSTANSVQANENKGDKNTDQSVSDAARDYLKFLKSQRR